MKPDLNGALTIFIGTLPLLGVILWNLLEVKTLRQEVRDTNKRIDDLIKKVGELAERLSKLEGKIEGRHVIVE